MVMDVAWRLGSALEIPQLFPLYEAAVRRSGKSIRIWELAYDEETLDGWNAIAETTFRPAGAFLDADTGPFDEDGFAFQVLTVDTVTAGDFSLEGELLAVKGEVNFCGFIFGRKGPSNFHGAVLFPGKTVAEGGVETGYLDLMTSYGGSEFKKWRHVPVDTSPPDDGRSSAGVWRRLRLDVSGRDVDVWFDGKLVTTHEFASREVLRGSFGLICGPGKARFRDLRYVSFDPRDPAAAIERDVRLEELREASGGGPLDGSYVGLAPPWPSVASWAQAPRGAWDDAGEVPQLLVLWSIEQNELVRIDPWLRALAKRTAAVGLEIVSVASFTNGDRLAAYLEEHAFPGSVGVDEHGDTHLGRTFEAYFVQRFNLPRLVLIDVDGTVAWEGDPGIEIGRDAGAGFRSYLDDPLDELVSVRKLGELAEWRPRWRETGLPALLRGDLATALPLLEQARELEVSGTRAPRGGGGAARGDRGVPRRAHGHGRGDRAARRRPGGRGAARVGGAARARRRPLDAAQARRARAQRGRTRLDGGPEAGREGAPAPGRGRRAPRRPRRVRGRARRGVGEGARLGAW